MVGMARFERATPASRTQCPTKLGHIPTSAHNNQSDEKCPSLFFEARLFFVSRYGRSHLTSITGRTILIIYDLKCGDGHKFEGWFHDRGTFEEQKARAFIACPVCGKTDASVMPSSVAVMGRECHSSHEKKEVDVSPMKALREFQEYIQKNFDDVGDKFTEVALRIHHGEEDKRNIKGTTTQSEEETLREEGVQFIKIPLLKFDA
jgi:hypothetical protein